MIVSLANEYLTNQFEKTLDLPLSKRFKASVTISTKHAVKRRQEFLRSELIHNKDRAQETLEKYAKLERAFTYTHHGIVDKHPRFKKFELVHNFITPDTTEYKEHKKIRDIIEKEYTGKNKLRRVSKRTIEARIFEKDNDLYHFGTDAHIVTRAIQTSLILATGVSESVDVLRSSTISADAYIPAGICFGLAAVVAASGAYYNKNPLLKEAHALAVDRSIITQAYRNAEVKI